MLASVISLAQALRIPLHLSASRRGRSIGFIFCMALYNLGSIFRCRNNNDYDIALTLSIYALGRFRHKKDRLAPGMENRTWWQCIKQGVDRAKHLDSEDLKDILVRMACEGIQPFEVYDVSYAYLEFSRLACNRKQYEAAVAYVRAASKADCTLGIRNSF